MATNDNVDRRTPDLPVALGDVASSLLEEARSGNSGHAAVTLTPAEGGSFMQTLVAVCEGRSLDPGHWNGPASLQVIIGEASISGTSETLTAGAWTTVPGDDADIAAKSDLVGLLTVVPQAG